MRFFLFALLLILVPAEGHSQSKSADNPAHTQQSHQTAQPSSSVTKLEVSNHPQNKTTDDKPERSSSFLDYLGVALTVVIAIAAVVQSGCAF